MFKITKKIKQFFGGNWGHPSKFEKIHTEIPDDFFEDKPGPWFAKRKRTKATMPKTAYWDMCPFCMEKLAEIFTTDKCSVLRNYAQYCACGARVHHDCPACHRSTWVKNGIYKHQWLGCGFEGERIVK